MCPGCSTVAGNPLRRASSRKYASIAAFWTPYSPKGVRGCASVVGTTALGPCTQIVPQWRKCCIVPRSASTRCRRFEREADHVDDDVGPELANLRAELPAASAAARSIVLLDRGPCAMRLIRLAPAAADRDHLMAGRNQARTRYVPTWPLPPMITTRMAVSP